MSDESDVFLVFYVCLCLRQEFWMASECLLNHLAGLETSLGSRSTAGKS